MIDTKSTITRIQNESDAWKRTLRFLLEENALSKSRLAEILNANKTTVDFLEMAEQYQTRFIQNDEIIKLIRQDIADFDKFLVKDMYEEQSFIIEVIGRQRKLQSELKSLEIIFSKLKRQFINYLGNHLEIKGKKRR